MGTTVKYRDLKKSGLIMHNHSVAMLGRVFGTIFNESVALKLLEEIFFYPNNGIEFYGEKLFVSRSTLTRILPGINRFLAQYGMRIQHTYNKYQIIADDEQYLRQFYAGFLIELYGLDLGKHQIEFDFSILFNVVVKTVKKSTPPEDCSFILSDDVFLTYNVMLYVISLIRENNSYHIDSEHITENEIDSREIEYIQSKFCNITEQNLRPIHEFIVNQHSGWDSHEENILLDREAKLFFEQIFETSKINPDQKTRDHLKLILKALYLTAKFRPYPTSCLFDRMYYFSLSVKKNNPYVYKLFDDNIRIFSKNINFDMTSKMNDILYWSCLNFPKICRYSKTKTALVVSDLGIQHAKYLSDCVADIFNTEYINVINLDCSVIQDIQHAGMKKVYDIIITTVQDLPIYNKNIILVGDYLTRENIFSIQNIIYSN